jgi:hypothetical protein
MVSVMSLSKSIVPSSIISVPKTTIDEGTNYFWHDSGSELKSRCHLELAIILWILFKYFYLFILLLMRQVLFLCIKITFHFCFEFWFNLKIPRPYWRFLFKIRARLNPLPIIIHSYPFNYSSAILNIVLQTVDKLLLQNLSFFLPLEWQNFQGKSTTQLGCPCLSKFFSFNLILLFGLVPHWI